MTPIIYGKSILGIDFSLDDQGNSILVISDDFKEYAKYNFKITDFPQEGIFLFAYPMDRGRWIVMLTQEY